MAGRHPPVSHPQIAWPPTAEVFLEQPFIPEREAVQITISRNCDSLPRVGAPNRKPTNAPDNRAIFFPGKPRLFRFKTCELVKLQNCARQHETAMPEVDR